MRKCGDRQAHRENVLGRMGCAPQVKELPEAERETWSESSPSAAQGAGSAHTWTWDSWETTRSCVTDTLLSVVLRDGSASRVTWGQSVGDVAQYLLTVAPQ